MTKSRSDDSPDSSSKYADNAAESPFIVVPSKGGTGNTIGENWEAINAKLEYQKHLQEEGLRNSLLTQPQPNDYGEYVAMKNATFTKPNTKFVPLVKANTDNSNSPEKPRTVFIGAEQMAQDSEAGEEEDSGEKKDFKSKRQGHYNEMHVLRAMRAKMAAEDDDDDDDNETDNNKNNNSSSTNNNNNKNNDGDNNNK